MPPDTRYSGRTANPLAALEKRQNVTNKALVRGLKASMDAIKGKIASASNPAFAASQERLYAEIAAAYAELAKTTDRYLKDEVAAAAKLGGGAAGKDSGASGRELVRWDEARCRRYWKYVSPSNGRKLAAVFTDRMAETTVSALRQSVVEVQRQAAIEGMSLKDQHKAIGERWHQLTGDDSNFQFVDRSGKAWDDARYLQMLSRTTAQRVYRDSYADRLAESGFQLVRITSLGAADCPVCKAWQGVICTLGKAGGKYPSIEEARAAGVWHPNCMCTMEYVDEDEDADDIEAQAEAGPVDWSDPDAVQERTDGIALDRFKAQGMDDGEAADALTRAQVEEALRTELFLENSEDLANGFSHEQLEDFRKHGIPDFALTKGKQKPGVDGGTVYIDRADPQSSLHEVLGVSPVHVEPPPPPPKWEPNLAALELAKGKVDDARRRAGDALDAILAAPDTFADFARLKADWGALADLSQAEAELAAARKDADDAKTAAEDAKTAAAAVSLADLATPTDEAAQKAFDTRCAALAEDATQKAKDAEAAKKTFEEAMRKASAALASANAAADAAKADATDAAGKSSTAAGTAAADIKARAAAARKEVQKLKVAAGLVKH